MISMKSKLVVADNSGAKKLCCISVIGASNKTTARIGDVIKASVVEASPNSKIKAGSVVTAVLVRCSYPINREDGSTIRFDENSAVLIDQSGAPRGTRIFGPVPRELRSKNYMKILSLAPEVL